MSARTAVNGYRLITRLQLHNHSKQQQYVVHKNQSFSFNPLFSKQSSTAGSSSFLKTRSLWYLRNRGTTGQTNKKSIRDFAIYSSDHQDTVTTFGSFMASWKSWIIGALMTVILPFLTNKWGPLLKWTKELEAAEERVEEIAEAIEKVAVGVEKIAEDIVENLPEGGRLKAAVTFVENAAKEVIKDADIVEDLIHKAEAVEKKVEAIIDGSKAKQVPQETEETK